MNIWLNGQYLSGAHDIANSQESVIHKLWSFMKIIYKPKEARFKAVSRAFYKIKKGLGKKIKKGMRIMPLHMKQHLIVTTC